MRTKLLVTGAINTDLVASVQRSPEAGETVTATAFNVFGGGKGANQAVSAARNQVPVELLGACGDDENGRNRLQDLRQAAVGTTAVVQDQMHASGVACIFVEPGGENRIAYYPGATQHITVENVLGAFDHVQPHTILSTNELPLECLIALWKRARHNDVRVVFNATPEPDLARDALHLVDVLIVNEIEANLLLGRSHTGEGDLDAYQELLRLGPSQIVVTLGARGAIAFNAEHRVRVAPPAVTVVDSTGAGDAFCGAFAAALVRGESLEQAVEFGVVSGALACEVPGAQPSSPTLERIRQRMAQ